MNKIMSSLLVAAFLIPVIVLGFSKAQRDDVETSQGKKDKVVIDMTSDDFVWVHTPDGAKSCEPGSGNRLELGAEKLKEANIQVFNSKKGSDGKMHAQVCGAFQGTTNVYQIEKRDLSRAKKLGFTRASASR